MKENSSGSLKWTGGMNPFVLVDGDDVVDSDVDEDADDDDSGSAGKAFASSHLSSVSPPSSPLLLVDEPRKRWALC